MKYDVVLVFSKLDERKNPPKVIRDHLGLAFLTTILRNNGYKVKLIHADNLCLTAEQTANEILNSKAYLIGFSVIQQNLRTTLKTIEILKKKRAKAKIILGGHHATLAYKYLLFNYPIDGIFCGEADEQILKIAERSKLGKNFKNIKGMAFTENGEIIYEPLDKAPDLDFSYLPARDAITQIDNQNPSQKIVKILSISSSRGCIGNCIYCTIPNFYKKPYKEWTIWRGRAANIVVNEIENLIELFKPNWFENFITFVDDDFLSVSDARERAYQIADEILTRKIKGFYKFSSRADSLLKDIKLLKYLYKAGFVSVFIGVEGGTDKVLKIYRKGLKIDQIKKAIHLLRDINMFRYDIGFILFNPFISIEELFKSAAFLKDIGIGTPSIWFWQLQALPGTSFEETLINDNLAKPNFSHFLPYEYYFIDKKVERICQFIMKHVQNERIILNMSGLLSKLADILLLLKRLKKIKKEVVEKLDKTLQ
ncbi:radical SAM domain-containing protein [Thermosipho africanus Ob7]|uniref:B12-binding domain-containing radical SAM protein n=1 Tax=Thermosipho africanus TaxID=2421 RepID=UPI000E0C7C80|nr:radical SAM protein [Thermosipho africanus]RDI90931.1 radical SAM domain-containing protein [Thermosipho africanus Ob7]